MFGKYSNAAIVEHPLSRLNIVITSTPLIISKYLRMPYEFYLSENRKTKHFTRIGVRFTGNFDLPLVNNSFSIAQM